MRNNANIHTLRANGAVILWGATLLAIAIYVCFAAFGAFSHARDSDGPHFVTRINRLTHQVELCRVERNRAVCPPVSPSTSTSTSTSINPK
jgi:hypothetical protein